MLKTMSLKCYVPSYRFNISLKILRQLSSMTKLSFWLINKIKYLPPMCKSTDSIDD